MWYRISFNRDGSVQDCKQVEVCGKGSVFYVEADSAADATSKAKREREKYLAAMKVCRQDMRAHLQDPAKPIPNKPRIKNGALVEQPRFAPSRTPPGTAWDPAVSEQRWSLRRVVLEETLKALDTLNPRKFREWLVSEIEAERG
jgi:hypothetical protein